MALNQAKKTRRTRGSLSREEILSAALDILQEEGLEKLSMRRIAQRMQCSVASPYAYFKSQEEIVRSLIVIGEQQLTTELKQARASRENVFEQLEVIARTYWSFSTQNRELHKLMFNMNTGVLYRNAFPSLPTSYRVFLDTIRRGILAGEIRFDRSRYRAIARTMWAWMYGLIVLEMGDMLRTKKPSDPIEEGVELFQLLLQKGGADETSLGPAES